MSHAEGGATLVVGPVSESVVAAARSAPEAETSHLTLPEFARRLAAPEPPRPAAERILVTGETLASLVGRRGGGLEALARRLVSGGSLWVASLDRAPAALRRALTRLRFTGNAPVVEPVATFAAKRSLVALTLDYETWHPLPEGWTIDWDKDVFEPARRFAAVAAKAAARLTYFVELGEYFFLRRFEPAVAARMEDQWRDLVRAGHDVQLHLHPDWLPELGARREGDRWRWDARLVHANDYPGDLGELFARCRRTLEDVLTPEDPSYAVSCYRAGAYRAQPFGRTSAALRQAGILCDSSVFRGGVSAERRYDYTHAYSAHQPYYCSPDDPQLAARAGDETILELPITTFGFGRRWSMDGMDQGLLAERLERYAAGAERPLPGTERHLAVWRALERASTVAHVLSRGRVPQRPWLPSSSPPGELSHGHDYFVAIGHTKGEHDFEGLEAQLSRIGRGTDVSWVTLSRMATTAREDLGRAAEWRSLQENGVGAVSSLSPPGEDMVDAIAGALEHTLPWAGREVRLIGDLAGRLAPRLEARFPWKRFEAAEPGASPEGADLECAVLAHAGPLAEIAHAIECSARDLPIDGTLLVPVPFETERLAYPRLATARLAVVREWRFRLSAAGFRDTRVVEEGIDPQLAGVVMARPSEPLAAHDTLRRVMAWLYEHVRPADGPEMETEPFRVLEKRRALCLGYASTLGAILLREGYGVEYVTLLARDHERGRPPHGTDSHEVLEVREPGGVKVVLDPTANVLVPAGLDQLLRNPSLAPARETPDARWQARRYDLYSTVYFYERVYEACVRPSLDVLAYDAEGSWRAWLKAIADLGRRVVYRRAPGGDWHRVRLPLDPRARVR
ncbi:MAG TPA: hypothetical protein VE359_18510 [Vicinamibacteria bacterium]|nr:hypothetical protein [Vicinamibacteria bacterium]